jgi:ribonuclease J
VRVRIHRGTREIGGTCIELESAGFRILLDLGLPLDAADLASTPLPDVEGLAESSATLLGIVLSHGHRDHWGLIPKVSPQIPLVMGRATESIIRAAADFVPDAVMLNAAQYLEHGKPIQLGPFTVLPRLVDHSGFDA